jgi:hypothetical protein
MYDINPHMEHEMLIISVSDKSDVTRITYKHTPPSDALGSW